MYLFQHILSACLCGVILICWIERHIAHELPDQVSGAGRCLQTSQLQHQSFVLSDSLLRILSRWHLPETLWSPHKVTPHLQPIRIQYSVHVSMAQPIREQNPALILPHKVTTILQSILWRWSEWLLINFLYKQHPKQDLNIFARWRRFNVFIVTRQCLSPEEQGSSEK